MTHITTKGIERIEGKLSGLEEGSIRHLILQSAKNFKVSWVELGQNLYTVWKDRLYKQWGYQSFDSYSSKEVGIRKDTALKLLKSYYFLEKEHPDYAQKEYTENAGIKNLPSYEAINVLRLAKGKNTLDASAYAQLKRGVFEMGKDARDVKKELTSLIRQREELEPDEARRRRRAAQIKRLLTVLKTLRTDLENSKMLPSIILKEVNDLIRKVEAEIS